MVSVLLPMDIYSEWTATGGRHGFAISEAWRKNNAYLVSFVVEAAAEDGQRRNDPSGINTI